MPRRAGRRIESRSLGVGSGAGRGRDAAERGDLCGFDARRAAIDCAIWTVAIISAVLLRYDFHTSSLHAGDIAIVVPLVLAAQLTIGGLLGLYVGRWMTGSFDELPALAYTVGGERRDPRTVDCSWRRPRPIPLSAALIVGGVLAFVLMGAARSLWRHLADAGGGRAGRPDRGRSSSEPATVASRRSERCSTIPTPATCPSRSSTTTPRSSACRSGASASIGNRSDLADGVERFRRAGPCSSRSRPPTRSLIRDLLSRAEDAGLDVQVLPSVKELLGGEVRVVDIREPNEVDLLGRHTASRPTSQAVSEYLTGQRGRGHRRRRLDRLRALPPGLGRSSRPSSS